MSRRSGSDAQTERIGAELAAELRGGDVIFLVGELGAGKTTFVRGAVQALGAGRQTSSPSFTIGQRYRIVDHTESGTTESGTAISSPTKSGATESDRVESETGMRARPSAPTEVAHLDLYRLKTMAGEDPDLLADYIDQTTITFVEWPEIAEVELRALATRTFRVTFTHLGGDEREIEIR